MFVPVSTKSSIPGARHEMGDGPRIRLLNYRGEPPPASSVTRTSGFLGRREVESTDDAVAFPDAQFTANARCRSFRRQARSVMGGTWWCCVASRWRSRLLATRHWQHLSAIKASSRRSKSSMPGPPASLPQASDVSLIDGCDRPVKKLSHETRLARATNDRPASAHGVVEIYIWRGEP